MARRCLTLSGFIVILLCRIVWPRKSIDDRAIDALVRLTVSLASCRRVKTILMCWRWSASVSE
ncbi:unnamed protein product [Nesidiocoris tenuis]|uniref:Secreted protein n=1 Tax=Nesidiocoris tenuis TaxID=355587 RepID=A0A6H5H6E6_9HEMI|nr:unnamed protein product [Nesidiocoris tenuis]